MTPPKRPLAASPQGAPLADRRSRIRGGSVVLATVIALFASVCSAQTFGDMLGLGVKFSQGQPLAELGTLEELRVRWVRDAIPWPEVEPQPGRYVDFSRPLQQRLDYYRTHDIGVVALLTLGNGQSYAQEPYEPERFGRYAAEVAKKLKSQGLRFAIELGNEPHNSALAKRMGGNWNGKPPAPWLSHYARMVQAGVKAVKAVDASIPVLSDDDMWVVHYWLLEAGLPRELDGFAVHPYVPGIPERAAVAQDTDWMRPFVAVDADRSFSSAVRRLRDQGAAKLGRTPQIWITEWGWPAGSGPKQVSEETVAAYLPRAFVTAAAAGVKVVCWFSAQDAGDGPMGLSDNHQQRRAAYTAFKVMAQTLGPQTFVRRVASRSATAGVQAYLFEGQGQRTLVLWNADGAPSRVPLPASNGGQGAIDAFGRPVALDEQHGLRFDALPIYVPGGWSDAEISAAVYGF